MKLAVFASTPNLSYTSCMVVLLGSIPNKIKKKLSKLLLLSYRRIFVDFYILPYHHHHHRSRLQQRSLALVVCKPIKNENISLNFKVSVLSVAPVEFVAL